MPLGRTIVKSIPITYMSYINHFDVHVGFREDITAVYALYAICDLHFTHGRLGKEECFRSSIYLHVLHQSTDDKYNAGFRC